METDKSTSPRRDDAANDAIDIAEHQDNEPHRALSPDSSSALSSCSSEPDVPSSPSTLAAPSNHVKIAPKATPVAIQQAARRADEVRAKMAETDIRFIRAMLNHMPGDLDVSWEGIAEDAGLSDAQKARQEYNRLANKLGWKDLAGHHTSNGQTVSFEEKVASLSGGKLKVTPQEEEFIAAIMNNFHSRPKPDWTAVAAEYGNLKDKKQSAEKYRTMCLKLNWKRYLIGNTPTKASSVPPSSPMTGSRHKSGLKKAKAEKRLPKISETPSKKRKTQIADSEDEDDLEDIEEEDEDNNLPPIAHYDDPATSLFAPGGTPFKNKIADLLNPSSAPSGDSPPGESPDGEGSSSSLSDISSDSDSEDLMADIAPAPAPDAPAGSHYGVLKPSFADKFRKMAESVSGPKSEKRKRLDDKTAASLVRGIGRKPIVDRVGLRAPVSTRTRGAFRCSNDSAVEEEVQEEDWDGDGDDEEESDGDDEDDEDNISDYKPTPKKPRLSL